MLHPHTLFGTYKHTQSRTIARRAHTRRPTVTHKHTNTRTHTTRTVTHLSNLATPNIVYIYNNVLILGSNLLLESEQFEQQHNTGRIFSSKDSTPTRVKLDYSKWYEHIATFNQCVYVMTMNMYTGCIIITIKDNLYVKHGRAIQQRLFNYVSLLTSLNFTYFIQYVLNVSAITSLTWFIALFTIMLLSTVVYKIMIC